MRKGQGGLEYLIIIAAVLAISAVVVFFVTGSAGTSKSEAMYKNCQEAAVECSALKAINPNNPCNLCDDKCIDLVAETELFPGAIECCKKGQVEDIYEGNRLKNEIKSFYSSNIKGEYKEEVYSVRKIDNKLEFNDASFLLFDNSNGNIKSVYVRNIIEITINGVQYVRK